MPKHTKPISWGIFSQTVPSYRTSNHTKYRGAVEILVIGFFFLNCLGEHFKIDKWFWQICVSYMSNHFQMKWSKLLRTIFNVWCTQFFQNREKSTPAWRDISLNTKTQNRQQFPFSLHDDLPIIYKETALLMAQTSVSSVSWPLGQQKRVCPGMLSQILGISSLKGFLHTT